jgi:formamidopyrimidine-DNA glycosylase
VHSHVRLLLSSGQALRLHDLRKFGRLYLVDDPSTVLGRLGREPLAADFTVEALGAIVSGRRRQIKPLLFDQRLVAGLGNIYIDESLWEARVHPLRHADTLAPDEVLRLHAAMQNVLARAIAHNGTTLRDYRDPHERPGQHQGYLVVYGRRGAACPRCGQAIARTVVGQRGTYYCPACQVLPQSGTDAEASAPV